MVLLLFFASSARTDTVGFESPPVHPLEASADGTLLYAAHTGEHRVTIYSLATGTPRIAHEIAVGLEPVSVRERVPGELWVVNHLSDSISVVDVTSGILIDTIVVGDEPTDVVFAGNPTRAFVVLSQEDALLVIDPANRQAAGQRIELELSDPRSIARSTDGATLYVTALEGGNRTTAIPFLTVDALGGPPAPNPPMSGTLPAAPRVALIVQQQSGVWRDETGAPWDAAVPYDLLDHDLARVDVASRTVLDYVGDVGSNMFNVAVDASDGSVYVSNQDARNLERFEPNLRARFVQSRVTRIDGGLVTPRHLNEHIDYASSDGSAAERANSLAFPLDLLVDGVRDRVYVAAFSSAKVGVLNPSGDVLDRWPVGNGPAGLALDEARDLLYVLNAIDGTLQALRLGDGSVVATRSLGFEATTADLREGRRLFYDAPNSSAHGDLSCNSCHLFAGIDNIAWELGDPTGAMTPPPPGQLLPLPDFHPMKGPMTTQSLKGLSGTEPLHWRGDRTVFADFNGTFVSLLGRGAQLGGFEFDQMEQFLFSLRYPPNPFRGLDDALPATLDGADPVNGETLFLSGGLVGGLQCNSCHTVPTGENGQIIPGNLLNEDEAKVVPQLRNMYEKTRFDAEGTTTLRGFGYTHDGAVDDLFTFLQFPGFTFASDDDRRDVAAFLMAFDSGTHGAVGAQWTTQGAAAGTRLNQMLAAADLGRIGVIAKSSDAQGDELGWVYAGAGSWTPNRQAEPATTTALLTATASSAHPITFTAVVDGCQWRLGVDRDEDGSLDGDEVDGGSDPGDPSSTPTNIPTSVDPDDWLAGGGPRLWLAGANPVASSARIGMRMPTGGAMRLEIFDARGRRVRVLRETNRADAGESVVGWDVRDERGLPVPSGVYFARLALAGHVLTERMTVLR